MTMGVMWEHLSLQVPASWGHLPVVSPGLVEKVNINQVSVNLCGSAYNPGQHGHMEKALN